MEPPELHPIACENCRSKKSRCDRELPVCSQCTTNGLTCQYPQAHKRGIPSGYIALIEQRLLETELVVFDLLSTIYNSHIPIQPYRSEQSEREAIAEFNARQQKSAKIEEWKSSPLGTDEGRHAWWQSRADIIAHRTRSISGTSSSVQRMPELSDFGWAHPLYAAEARQGPCSAQEESWSTQGVSGDNTGEPTPSTPLRVDITTASISMNQVEEHGGGSGHASGTSKDIDMTLSTDRWRKYF